MKTYATMFCAMLAMGALTVSCSSEDEAVLALRRMKRYRKGHQVKLQL